MNNLSFVRGNIIKGTADAVVIPVNGIAGVMGAGLAKQAVEHWPELKLDHFRACKADRMRPGMIWPTLIARRGEYSPIFYLAATKAHFSRPSRLEWVGMCLDNLASDLEDRNFIRTLGLPALGCGLGNLLWNDVRPLIHAFAARVPDVAITAYLP